MQKRDPLWASTWLLLAPVFSYLQAALVLGEPIGWTDLFGSGLVVAGLIISGATRGQTSEKTEARKNET
jgi:drug/metabolite transporter (DMT)-like permease